MGETMSKALEQARVGRIHILDEMAKYLDKPRDSLPDTVPKVATFSIDPDAIGKVIGPGGKQIRAIIEDFGLVNMNVEENGNIQISSMNATSLTEAQEFTKKLIEGGGRGGGGGGGGGRRNKPEYAGPKPEIGATYKGKIRGIHQFGVFVEIMPGAEDGSTPGLEGFIRSMNTEELDVKLLSINEKGQLQLSRKAFLQDRKSGGAGKPGAGAGAGAGNENPNINAIDKEGEMSKAEIDVITKAIEGIE